MNLSLDDILNYKKINDYILRIAADTYPNILHYADESLTVYKIDTTTSTITLQFLDRHLEEDWLDIPFSVFCKE